MAWTIDGTAVTVDRESLELSATTLSLSFDVNRSDLGSWRAYDRAGDVALEEGYAGRFRAQDGGNAAEVTVSPDTADQPPVDEFTGFVLGYEEEQLSPDRVRVSLEIQRKRNRGRQFSTVSESATDDNVSVELDDSELALGQDAVAQTAAEGSPATRSHEIQLSLDGAQAGALADDGDRPGAVIERSITDEANTLVDESDGRQTILLSMGLDVDSVLPSGRYLVREWGLTKQSYSTTAWLASLSAALAASIWLVRSGETRTVSDGEALTIDADEALVRREGSVTIERGSSVTRERS